MKSKAIQMGGLVIIYVIQEANAGINIDLLGDPRAGSGI
jgi:hypothetical protein